MQIHEYGPISEAEYLRLEAQSPVRNEYVAGEIFAMTGGTLRHNMLAGRLYSRFQIALEGTPCRAFINDVRVQVEKHNAHYYPDIVVDCPRAGERLDLTVSTAALPILIVEVSSTRTEATDRREKLLAYRTLASMQEYVLVSQHRMRVEIHRRSGDIGWSLVEYGPGDDVELTAVGLKLGMSELYEGTEIDPNAGDEA